jgi:hypothetical protein
MAIKISSIVLLGCVLVCGRGMDIKNGENDILISWNGRALSWYKYILYHCRVFSACKSVCVVSPAIICYCAIISNELKSGTVVGHQIRCISEMVGRTSNCKVGSVGPQENEIHTS